MAVYLPSVDRQLLQRRVQVVPQLPLILRQLRFRGQLSVECIAVPGFITDDSRFLIVRQMVLLFEVVPLLIADVRIRCGGLVCSVFNLICIQCDIRVRAAPPASLVIFKDHTIVPVISQRLCDGCLRPQGKFVFCARPFFYHVIFRIKCSVKPICIISSPRRRIRIVFTPLDKEALKCVLGLLKFRSILFIDLCRLILQPCVIHRQFSQLTYQFCAVTHPQWVSNVRIELHLLFPSHANIPRRSL